MDEDKSKDIGFNHLHSWHFPVTHFHWKYLLSDFRHWQLNIKNSVMESVVMFLSFFAWHIKGLKRSRAFKQILQRHNTISFSIISVMKKGLNDKTVSMLTPVFFSWSFSFNVSRVHVAILLGPQTIILPLLFFFCVSSIKSLLISPYLCRYCLLGILISFLPFLPSVETMLFSSQVL